MLAKKYRFKNFDFKLFLKSEKKKNNYFLIRRLDNNQKKFAVLLTSKFLKKAVERNKIKRQIYEIIRNNLKKIKPGYYIIMPLKKNNYKELEINLLKLFN